MEDNEILEGNKLIAEFMGVEIGGPFQWRPGATTPLMGKMLAYHSDWGWIMPVVEKIESLKYCVKIEMQSCLIYRISSGPIEELYYDGTNAETKILAVYHRIVEFIKWYNSQAKTEI